MADDTVLRSNLRAAPVGAGGTASTPALVAPHARVSSGPSGVSGDGTARPHPARAGSSASAVSTAASESSPRHSESNNGPILLRKTKLFQRRRKIFIDRAHLESNRLHSRLEMLLQVGSNPSLTLPQLKEAEQTLVVWEPDDVSPTCRICVQPFSYLNLKFKHHCRTCGRLVCGSCTVKRELRETVTLRLCTTCVDTLALVEHTSEPAPVLATVYEKLANTRRSVAETIPQLVLLVEKLQRLKDPKHPETVRLRALATTFKKDVDEHLIVISELCQRISKLPTPTPSHMALHAALIRGFSSFAQSHIPFLNDASDVIAASYRPAVTIASLIPGSATSSTAGPIAAAARGVDSEDYLSALIEQYSQLEFAWREATQQRLLDDARTLKINIEELTNEIVRVETSLFGSSKFRVDPL
ncbi:hypothetical protein BC828DRAFT_391779 [Blastocladiella britannica]|nr:hypothetical protein BC828DRAFT_391779 [Blastocladiella britannica]